MQFVMEGSVTWDGGLCHLVALELPVPGSHPHQAQWTIAGEDLSRVEHHELCPAPPTAEVRSLNRLGTWPRHFTHQF
jgi:hypothetical protein